MDCILCWNGAYLYFNVPYIYHVAQVSLTLRHMECCAWISYRRRYYRKCHLYGPFFWEENGRKEENLKIKSQTRVISNLLCAVCILSFLAISRPNSTGKYTDNARQFVVAFVIGFILHSPFTFFFPVARGWCWMRMFIAVVASEEKQCMLAY